MSDSEYLEIDDNLYQLIRSYIDSDTDIVSDDYFEVRNKVINLIDSLRGSK